ncbi:DUF2946 domain-containing protein [Roseateles sp. SL47]|uniref:DUF2946 domain-containing protein n=1 Tax=Roseateles sp. SL47 TaxID=2995138 RepID=UPI00226D82B0|nr:DUF2946 domain-containing protein [Roseateles sp. SL47]WAC73083.1 DUF2946 domain-containing protein [Roseateles sp. SL47]
MLANRVTVTRFAWIVSLTILLGAWLPGFVHVWTSATGSEWSEICSANGTVRVKLPTASEDQTGKSPVSKTASSMDCPCCSIHHGTPSLPPSELLWTVRTTLQFEWPSLFLQAPYLLLPWAPSLARGPPLLT